MGGLLSEKEQVYMALTLTANPASRASRRGDRALVARH